MIIKNNAPLLTEAEKKYIYNNGVLMHGWIKDRWNSLPKWAKIATGAALLPLAPATASTAITTAATVAPAAVAVPVTTAATILPAFPASATALPIYAKVKGTQAIIKKVQDNRGEKKAITIQKTGEQRLFPPKQDQKTNGAGALVLTALSALPFIFRR